MNSLRPCQLQNFPKIVHSMSDFVMSVSCGGMLMKNFEAYMQQGVVTSPMTIEAFYNANLSTIKECATTSLTFKGPTMFFMEIAKK